MFTRTRPHAYGLTVFVRDGHIDALLARDRPQIGTHTILDDAALTGAILDPSAIGRGNASDAGLELLVVSTNVRAGLRSFDEGLGLLMKAYVDDHQGYRLSRIASEFFSEAYIDAVLANGGYVVRRIFDDVGGRRGFRSLVGTVTREEATSGRMGLFLPMFVYTPPVIRFTDAQQELLRLALAGGTDEWMSGQLGIPLTTVKARWLRIQQRAMRRMPALFEGVPLVSRQGRRGVQTRHVLLNYLRRMPSELTPYDPSPSREETVGAMAPSVGSPHSRRPA